MRLGLLFVLLALPAGAQSARSREFLRAHPWVADPELRLRQGDDAAWARPTLDDGEWQRIGARELPSNNGIYWVRARVSLAERQAGNPIDALAVAVVASYEIYWDGQLLGRSGVVGPDRISEVPGALDQVFHVPDALLTPGEHIVAFRMASFHTGFPGNTYALYFGLTTQRDYFTARSRAAAFAIIAVGGGFVLGVLLLLVGLLVQRRPAPILFGLLCLCASAVQALQAWRALFHYSYDWHFPRVAAQIASVAALGALLVAFVAVFFRVPRPWAWVGVGALATTAIGGWLINFSDANAILEILWWSALLLALGLAGWAWRRGERRAAFVVAGLLASCGILARSSVEFREESFLHGMGAALLGCIVALTLQLRADRQAARQAQLTAARLEIELLKKNIQPHFLLNTLTTLTEVIELQPKIAVQLIEALAAEFRLLARMAGERLVPMREELELCREHLRIMSLRREVRYVLRAEQVDEDALVPPALFLTLVENGLTHARPRVGDVEFVLRGAKEGDAERYVFHSPGGGPTGGANGKTPSPAREIATEGTGIRYVKARLEESFAGRWKFASGPAGTGWETAIEYRRTRLERGGA